jgi:hypothetical protein
LQQAFCHEHIHGRFLSFALETNFPTNQLGGRIYYTCVPAYTLLERRAFCD